MQIVICFPHILQCSTVVASAPGAQPPNAQPHYHHTASHCRLLGDEAAARNQTIEELMMDDDFTADNQRPSINGLSYCNMPSE